MNEATYLQKLERILKEEQFDCSLEPDAKAPPFGRILVFLGNDKLDRERILEITAQHQNLGEGSPEYTRVQFDTALPFSVRDHTANQIASLLMFLNRMLELPGFEFDAVNSQVFYRNVQLVTHPEPDKTLTTSIIGVILMLLTLFSDIIEQVAEGKITFEEILEQMLHQEEKS